MNSSMKLVATSVVVAFAVLSGCAVESEEAAAPGLEETGVEAQQAVTYNGFTLNAQTPVGSNWTWVPYIGVMVDVSASVVISGGSGSQKMGVCLEWQRVSSSSPYGPIPCTTTANCPAVATTGGAMYCAAPQNSGQKYCFERFGTQTQACAGSPANGGAPVGNGTYTTTPRNMVGGIAWVSYACVNGCTGSTPTPSISSLVTL